MLLLRATKNGKSQQEPIDHPVFIDKAKEGSYFTIPFKMPPNTESVTLSYSYERRQAMPADGGFSPRPEVNIIDLGLIDPSGRQVGASGSDKSEITVSETTATPGYNPWALVPGEWKILVGAYHVAPEGVTVTYEVKFVEKHRRWLKGDLHTHTIASDGVLTAEELGWRAVRHGLDFLAITDHNQMVSADALAAHPRADADPGGRVHAVQGACQLHRLRPTL